MCLSNKIINNQNISIMRKNFLLLMLMALLPLAGWASTAVDITGYTVTLELNGVETNNTNYTGTAIANLVPTKLSKGTDEITSGLAIGKWTDKKSGKEVTELKDAGTYIAYVQADGQLNFATAEFTINKIDLTISIADGKEITFGEAAPATYGLSYSGLVNADKAGDGTPKEGVIVGTITYAVEKDGVPYKAGHDTEGEVGTDAYDIIPNITGITSANYNLKPQNAKLTVKAKALTDAMIQNIDAKTYDGTNYLSAFKGGVSLKDDKNVTSTNHTLDATTNYTVKIATGKDAAADGTIKDAGDYWVTVSGTGNYTGKAYKQIKINKKNLAISTNSESSTYGDAITLGSTAAVLKNFVVFDGLESGDVSSSYEGVPDGTAFTTGTYDLNVELWKNGAKVANPEKAAGTYDVVVVPASTYSVDNLFKNYNAIIFNGGTYTVNKKDLTFDTKNQSKKQGETNALDNASGVTPTASNYTTYFSTISAIVSGESISVYPTLTANGNTIAVNTTGVKVVRGSGSSAVDVTANYNISATTATYTVAKGQINVKPVNVRIAYGDAEEKVKITLVGVAAADKDAAEEAILKGVTVETTGKGVDDNGAELTPVKNVTYPNAGIYKITFDKTKIDLGTLDYDLLTFDGTYTITKRELKKINPLEQTIAVGATAAAAASDETIEFVKKNNDTYDLTDTDKRIMYGELNAVNAISLSASTSTAGRYQNGLSIVNLVNANVLSNFKVTEASDKAYLSVANVNTAGITLDRTKWNVDAQKPTKLIGDNNNKITNVKFGSRVLAAQKWNSFVLPFEISVGELAYEMGYAVVNVLNEENSKANDIRFKLEMGIIPANTPFLMKTYKEVDLADKSFSNVLIEKPATWTPTVTNTDGNVKFVGIYDRTAIAGNQIFPVNAVTNNDWIKGQEGVYLTPLAAYLETTAAAAARGINITVQEADGTTTAISSINADGTAVEADGWYSVNGVKVQGAPTQKGVYIRNGKKIVVK